MSGDKRKRTRDGVVALNSVSDIRESLQLGPNVGRGMPSEVERRTKKLSEMDDEAVGRLQHFAETVFQRVCEILAPNDSKTLAEETAKRIHRKSAAHEDKLLANMQRIIEAMPERNLQARVLMAPICGSFSTDFLKEKFGLGQEKVARGRRHCKHMLKGYSLQDSQRHIQRYSKENVKKAVDYFLHERNVQLIPGSRKTLILDGNELSFPRLERKLRVEYIFRNYLEFYPERSERIGGTIFRRIVKLLTDKESDPSQTMDHASTVLLYDNFDLIRRMVASVDPAEQDRCMKVVNALERFMKEEYEAHIASSEMCQWTKPEYSLHKEDVHSEDVVGENCNCNVCNMPFMVFQYLRRLVDPVHLSLLNDCSEKVQHYLGHRVRVNHQRLKLEKMLDGLEAHQACVILDFKERFEPLIVGEKSAENGGERGITWHGAMIYTKTITGASLEGDADVDSGKNLHAVYYDHISSGATKQDWRTVLCNCEAILSRLHKDFPTVTEVSMYSDNAPCYRKPELLFLLSIVAQSIGLELVQLVHSQSEDERSLLEAHFSQSMSHVLSYLRTGNNVVTEGDLVMALRANGGVKNSVAELMVVNYSKIQTLVDGVKDILRRFRHAKHVNEATFNNAESTITCREYSDVGEGVVYSTDLSVEVEPQDDVEGVESASDFDELYDEEDDELLETRPDDDDAAESLGDIRTTGLVTGCLIVADQVQLSKQKARRTSTLDIVNMDIEEAEEQDSPKNCPICRKDFLGGEKGGAHPCINGRKDSEFFALQYAAEKFKQGLLYFVPAATNDSDQREVLHPIALMHQSHTRLVRRGWACRPSNSAVYGREYIADFKQDIERMHAESGRNGSPKLSAGRVREALLRLYPGRIDVPSESEIQRVLNASAFRRRKNRVTALLMPYRGIKEPYLSECVRIFEQSEGTIKPADAWRLFVARFPCPEGEEAANYPSAAKFQSKISNLKTKIRKSSQTA
ncbi:hypothetical protein NDN08_008149 [Rhodosorus marinus]|uniref:Uncharacterized protein n=1 Tax=Rhodosorus marinus TaxID=101924 RepID=A0AAV8V3V6_9RHOD|nr:hypothetical protein NDN08_008149 [Rhodosorus marinus]